MMAASLRFRSVCEEDLDIVLNDKKIHTKTIGLFGLDFYARLKSRAHDLILRSI